MTAALRRGIGVSERAHAAVKTFMSSALAIVLADLGGSASGLNAGPPPGCVRFFTAVFAAATTAQLTTVHDFALSLGIRPETLISRFLRASLPGAKQYLVWTRLIAVARLLEDAALPIAAVVLAFGYSSSQALTRHTRRILGMTPGELRATFDGAGLLERFRATLTQPYRDILAGFDPLRPPRLAQPTHDATPAATVRARRVPENE